MTSKRIQTAEYKDIQVLTEVALMQIKIDQGRKVRIILRTHRPDLLSEHTTVMVCKIKKDGWRKGGFTDTHAACIHTNTGDCTRQ